MKNKSFFTIKPKEWWNIKAWYYAYKANQYFNNPKIQEEIKQKVFEQMRNITLYGNPEGKL